MRWLRGLTVSLQSNWKRGKRRGPHQREHTEDKHMKRRSFAIRKMQIKIAVRYYHTPTYYNS